VAGLLATPGIRPRHGAHRVRGTLTPSTALAVLGIRPTPRRSRRSHHSRSWAGESVRPPAERLPLRRENPTRRKL
jgi:hypothetical protein